MTVIYLPFVILPIFPGARAYPALAAVMLRSISAPVRWDTFRRIVLPLSLPGTIAGGLFAFVLALGDFITPQMVGGTTGFTIGRVIFSQFGLAYNWPFGSAIAAILLARRSPASVLAGYRGQPAEGLIDARPRRTS